MINNKSDLIQAADDLWDEGNFVEGINLLTSNWEDTFQMTDAEDLETLAYAAYFMTQIDPYDIPNGDVRFGEKAIARKLHHIAKEAVFYEKGLTTQGREWFKRTVEFLNEEDGYDLRSNPEDWDY